VHNFVRILVMYNYKQLLSSSTYFHQWWLTENRFLYMLMLSLLCEMWLNVRICNIFRVWGIYSTIIHPKLFLIYQRKIYIKFQYSTEWVCLLWLCHLVYGKEISSSHVLIYIQKVKKWQTKSSVTCRIYS